MSFDYVKKEINRRNVLSLSKDAQNMAFINILRWNLFSSNLKSLWQNLSNTISIRGGKNTICQFSLLLCNSFHLAAKYPFPLSALVNNTLMSALAALRAHRRPISTHPLPSRIDWHCIRRWSSFVPSHVSGLKCPRALVSGKWQLIVGPDTYDFL